MSQDNGYDDDPREPTTPFDEATDLIEEDEEPVEITRVRMPPATSLVFLVAILVSPLFALVFGLDFALGVLVVAMAVTSWLAWEGASRLVPAQGALLRKAALMNALVAVLVLLLLIARVTGLV